MKQSFKKAAVTAEVTPETEAPKAAQPLATRPKVGPLGAVQHKGADDMYGEWLPKDSKLPRLNIRQKSSSGELGENFEFGDLVFAKKIKLADAETPVIVIPVVAGKDYQQVVKFGEGQGVVYPTAQAVLDNGGTLDWSKDAINESIYFGPRAHIQFAIKAPAELSEEDLNFFPFEFGGDRWAMSIYTVASSAYTSLAKELETLRRYNMIMMKGLVYGRLELTTKFKQKPPQQEWYVPIVKLAGENPAGLIEFLEAIK